MAQPILVTGVGGKVGGVAQKIVECLLERDIQVRAMLRTRNPHLEKKLEKKGVEIVIGDLTDLSEVHRAIKDCKRLYFGMSVSAHYLEATTNTAAVAKHHGIECFVNISQMTVSQMSITESTPSPQQKLHWLCEQALNWSGLPVVHVRPTVFLEHPFFLQWAAESIIEFGEIRLPFGQIKTSPIATIDVARAITEILIHPKNHLGKVYELTGSKSETLSQITNHYSAALGQSIRYADVPFENWEAELLSKGLPPHVAAHISAMALLHRENRYDRLTGDIQKITGTAPMSIREWVTTQAERFRAKDSP